MCFKKEDGYISIEYVLVMCFVMIFFLVIVAFVVYLFPYYEMKGYTSELTTKIGYNGGLTMGDYMWFMDKLYDRGVDTNKVEICVEDDTTGENAMYIPPNGIESDDFYVEKGNSIYIRIEIPAGGYSYGNSIFQKMKLKNRLNETYGYEYYVASERV